MSLLVSCNSKFNPRFKLSVTSAVLVFELIFVNGINFEVITAVTVRHFKEMNLVSKINQQNYYVLGFELRKILTVCTLV